MNNNIIYINHDFSQGWPAAQDLYYQCQLCGVLVSSIEDGQCACKNVHVDASGARAGAEDESKVRLVKQTK